MLAPWVSYCRIGEMAVFLDVKRDRYRAMAWDSAQTLVGATGTPVPGTIAKRARALGWLDEGTTGTVQSPPALLPPEELGPEAMACRPSARGIAQALWRLGGTRVNLAMRSLESVLAEVTDRNRATGSGEGGPVLSAVAPTLAAYRAAERYVLASNTCLLRSLALHAALADRGVAASVIFGVKLHPFEAHCWVQRGATLLNDTVERTGLFVPIRAVH